MGQQVIEIDDFGPVTVRALSRREWEELQREHRDDPDLRVALVIQRGVVKPKFADLERLEGRDEAINAIANAIIDLTGFELLGGEYRPGG